MFYEWDPILETGNKEIDAQHKELFNKLNNIIAAYQDGRDTEELQKTLDFLVEYTVQHFHDEEKLQKLYSYPDYNRHKEYHEAFKKTVVELLRELKEKNYSKELTEKVITTVSDWLLNHIKGDDFRLAAHISEENSKRFKKQ
ncbi:hemerythrin [Parelusimicrobium proximum]|uniref:bacteriohemerythrin n=1 Tax=Parelusimicrobium proximum TaxID=3228953 RepID=UPI003D169934